MWRTPPAVGDEDARCFSPLLQSSCPFEPALVKQQVRSHWPTSRQSACCSPAGLSGAAVLTAAGMSGLSGTMSCNHCQCRFQLGKLSRQWTAVRSAAKSLVGSNSYPLLSSVQGLATAAVPTLLPRAAAVLPPLLPRAGHCCSAAAIAANGCCCAAATAARAPEAMGAKAKHRQQSSVVNSVVKWPVAPLCRCHLQRLDLWVLHTNC